MPIEIPKLSFELAPNVGPAIERSRTKLERLEKKLNASAFPQAMVEQAYEQWIQGNHGYFQRGIGANRLVALLLHHSELAADNALEVAIFRAAEAFPSRTLVIGLMAWCKLNWSRANGSAYQVALNQASHALGLVGGGQSKLRYGIGPLLPFLQEKDGHDTIAAQIGRGEGAWDRFIQHIGLTDFEVSGEFFERVAKTHLYALMDDCPASEFNEVVVGTAHSLCDGRLDGVLLPLISSVIHQVEKLGVDHEEIMQLAIRKIGDPTSPNWLAVDGLSALEKKKVSEAAYILDQWVNELFLDRFWQLITDRGRQQYWKKRKKSMRDVRLAISDAYYHQLPAELKVGEYRKRLHRTSNNALLIFKIGERSFIEFGERASGPLQVVHSSSQNGLRLADALNRSSRSAPIASIIDPASLKFHSATGQLLIRHGSYFAEEGKLNHNTNWQLRLDQWFAWVNRKMR